MGQDERAKSAATFSYFVVRLLYVLPHYENQGDIKIYDILCRRLLVVLANMHFLKEMKTHFSLHFCNLFSGNSVKVCTKFGWNLDYWG